MFVDFFSLEKQKMNVYLIFITITFYVDPFKSTNYTATNLPSRKLSNLDEPGMQDPAREAETSS